MMIRIPEDRMKEMKRLQEIVDMLATCEGELPWNPDDNLKIDMYGIRHGVPWFITFAANYLISIPSDHWLVYSERFDKPLESDFK